MRTSALLIATLVLLPSIAGLSSAARTPEKTNVFDGFFMPAGEIPAAFQNINMIMVVEPARASSPPYGWIELKGARAQHYPLLKATLDSKTLSFKTRAVRGVGYEFTGTLPKTEIDITNNEIVLTGTMKKLQAGRVIAEGKMSFTWYAGD